MSAFLNPEICDEKQQEVETQSQQNQQQMKKSMNKNVNFITPRVNSIQTKLYSPSRMQKQSCDGLINKSMMINLQQQQQQQQIIKYQSEDENISIMTPQAHEIIKPQQVKSRMRQHTLDQAIEITQIHHHQNSQNFSSAYQNYEHKNSDTAREQQDLEATAAIGGYDKNDDNKNNNNNNIINPNNNNNNADNNNNQHDNNGNACENSGRAIRCKFCLQTTRKFTQKKKQSNNMFTQENFNTENNQENYDDDEDDSHYDEESVNYTQTNQREEDEENNNNNKEKQNQQQQKQTNNKSKDDFVRVCRCEKNSYSHKSCLVYRTINNRYKCRLCMTLATFTTKKNWSKNTMVKNYKVRKNEVKSIFMLFGFTIIFFLSILFYLVYLFFNNHHVDAKDIIIWCCCTLAVTILLFYGLVFFLKSLHKLCVVEIDSDIKLEELIEKKQKNNQNNNSKNEVLLTNNNNNNNPVNITNNNNNNNNVNNTNILYTNGCEENQTNYEKNKRFSTQLPVEILRQIQLNYQKKVLSPTQQQQQQLNLFSLDSRKPSIIRRVSYTNYNNQSYNSINNQTTILKSENKNRFQKRSLTCFQQNLSRQSPNIINNNNNNNFVGVTLPYQRQIFQNSLETEQSPQSRISHQQQQQNQQFFQQPKIQAVAVLPVLNNYKNSQSPKSNSNEGNKSNTHSGSSLSERNRKPSLFQLQLDPTKQTNYYFNNNNNDHQQQEQFSSGLTNKTAINNNNNINALSNFDDLSGLSKKQMIDSSKFQIEQTSRFGQKNNNNNNLEHSNKKTNNIIINNNNLITQEFKENIPLNNRESNSFKYAEFIKQNCHSLLKNNFIEMNHIKEESLNTSRNSNTNVFPSQKEIPLDDLPTKTPTTLQSDSIRNNNSNQHQTNQLITIQV